MSQRGLSQGGIFAFQGIQESSSHSEQKERGWHACVGVSHAEGTVWRTRDLDRWRRGPTVQPVLASLGSPKRQSSRRAMLRSCEGGTLRTTGRRGVTVSIFWGRRKTARPWKNLLMAVGGKGGGVGREARGGLMRCGGPRPATRRARGDRNGGRQARPPGDEGPSAECE